MWLELGVPLLLWLGVPVLLELGVCVWLLLAVHECDELDVSVRLLEGVPV